MEKDVRCISIRVVKREGARSSLRLISRKKLTSEQSLLTTEPDALDGSKFSGTSSSCRIRVWCSAIVGASQAKEANVEKSEATKESTHGRRKCPSRYESEGNGRWRASVRISQMFTAAEVSLASLHHSLGDSSNDEYQGTQSKSSWHGTIQ
jgi:hypothetical protein